MNIVERLLQMEPDRFGRAEEKEIEIKRLSRLLGEPFYVRCKGIHGERFTEISTMAVDEDGDADLSKMFDINTYVALDGIVSPDLKDERLLKHYGCSTPKDLLQKLFNGGEIVKIADVVTELSGYGKDSDKKIKNLSSRTGM